MMHLSLFLKKIFYLDSRSVALFRVCLGGMILLDLALRARNLKAHYTDSGVLPREAVENWVWNIDHFSAHMWSGGAGLQIFLFLLAGIFAALLMVGKWPKIALFASWVLLLSLHHRDPVILDGGDALLRLLMFWGLFIPLSTPISKSGETPSKNIQLFSLGTVAFFIQVICVYVFSGWLKSGASWQDGSAVYYVMQLDMHITILGKSLQAFPSLMESLTFLTVFIEKWGFLLLLLGGLSAYFRYLAIAVFMALHLGFLLTLSLGIFPLVGMLCWIMFLPTHFWEKGLGKRLMAIVASKPSSLKDKIDKEAYAWAYSAGKGLRAVIILFSLYLMLGWNALSVGKEFLPSQMDPYVMHLGLTQNWNLFSPDPIKNDGWYIVEKTQGGEKKDLWNKGELSFDKPVSVNASYRNQRWRKYWKQIKKRRYKELKPYLAAYFCEKGNDLSENIVGDSLRIIFMQERSEPFGQPNEIIPRVIWEAA
ncbi:MAG: HTTM domain-containing protein, partial [Bacteroidota bacterium]